MKLDSLSNMTGGWFLGDFEPSVVRSTNVEVAVKTYSAGDSEEWHHHKIATEITVIVTGNVEMNGRRYGAGDILVIEPGEGTDFTALTDVVNVVVKLPSSTSDKFVGRDSGVADALPEA